MKGRKLLVGLLGTLLGITVVTGCASKEKGPTVNGKKIEKIDAMVTSFRVVEKEIYLTESFEDFALQFQGLGCKFYPDDTYNEYSATDPEGTIIIDEIKGKDHPFYSTNGDQYAEIVCPIPQEEKEKAVVQLQFKYTGNDEDLYIDRGIVSWVARENIQIGEKDNIIYVDCKDKYSEIKDVERIYGTNNKKETDLIHKDEIDKVYYELENNPYQIDFNLFYPTLSKDYEHKVSSVWVKKRG